MRETAILLLFTASGALSLVYELLWVRSFGLVFGSGARAVSAVLAVFFGGLALGNALGARLLRSGRDPLRVYAGLEIAVGAAALCVPAWLGLHAWLYPALWSACAGEGAWLDASRVALALAALGPATLAMGATLPVMAAARAAQGPPAGAARARPAAAAASALYALNTLGAAAGALLAGFVLPTLFGVSHSTRLAAAGNALVAGLAWLSALRWPADPAALRYAEPEAPASGNAGGQRAGTERSGAHWLPAAAATAGFSALALEVVYTRLLQRISMGTVYAFAITLVVFLLCIALGAAAAALALRRVRPWPLLCVSQLAAGVGTLFSPQIAARLLASLPESDPLAWVVAKTAAIALLVVGPPVMAGAMALPTTWALAAGRSSGFGARVGALSSANTLAGVAGSLAAGFALLPAPGIAASLPLLASLQLALAIAAGWRSRDPWLRVPASGLALAGLGVWIALGAWRLDPRPLERGERLVSYREDESASVAVIDSPQGYRALEVDQTYLLGTTRATARQARQGRLPLLLHGDPHSALFLGAATGISVSAFLDFPVERAVAAELLRGVAEALPEFAHWNRGAHLDPRFELSITDARNWLRGSRERFDVIVGDLYVPWHAGTGYLYTREHFAAAKARLAAGGLFAQWLPGYQLLPEELRVITATFLDVFPEAALWRNDFDPAQPMLALLGAANPGWSPDPERVRSASARLARIDFPVETFLAAPAGVELLFVAGPEALERWAEGAERNLDDRPRLEYAAPHSLPRLAALGSQPLRAELAQLSQTPWSYAQRVAPGVPPAALAAAKLALDRAAEPASPEVDAALTRAARDFGALPGVAQLLLEAAARRDAAGQRASARALRRALPPASAR